MAHVTKAGAVSLLLVSNHCDMDETFEGRHASIPTASNDQGWVDQLVELHVLAEHGDTSAAQQAEAWVAEDSAARTVWESVEHACAQVRTGRPRST